jgi:molecular chaperone GrpE
MEEKSKKGTISYISEEEDSDRESKIKKLKKKLKQCRREKEEYMSEAQRARADFVNYQKRQEDRLSQIKQYAGSEIINDVLAVLESLEKGAETNEDLVPIKKQMESVLKKHGVREVKALGEKFDPNYHEAVAEEDSKEESGVVIEEYQKGYMLHDKLLRPSRVKIAK